MITTCKLCMKTVIASLLLLIKLSWIPFLDGINLLLAVDTDVRNVTLFAGVSCSDSFTWLANVFIRM